MQRRQTVFAKSRLPAGGYVARRSTISAIIATLITTSPHAVADSNAVIEEIVVTGTRLSRDINLAAAQPVQTVTAEQIELSGEFEIADVVNDLPALSTSSTAEQSFGSQGRTGINTNVLTLRALGPNRTLVLVNGRRHVPGQQGSSAVDVGSISPSLIERVEVFTGGASAVYGADAVTGVVNFVLKEDYEGLEFDIVTGLSREGDGEQTTLTAVWGRNIADERGNLTVSATYQNDAGLLVSDRPDELFATARPFPNPALRFQRGDVTTEETPNLAAFLDPTVTGLYSYGLPIPSAAEFSQNYETVFGAAPVLTAAEQALFNRAANAPPLALQPGATFQITGPYGRIIPGNPYNFQGFSPLTPIDLNANGTPDCLDSFTGYNSTFAPGALGVIGGCWNVSADGTYAPINDGLIATNAESYFGDSFAALRDIPEELINANERLTLNILGDYRLNDTVRLFWEGKYARQTFNNSQRADTFWDSLFGAADNPFLPEFIQPLAQTTGGVAITIDPAVNNPSGEFEYVTERLVVGIDGELSNNWEYEASVNYGRFVDKAVSRNNIIVDRWFAAIDAVSDPTTGQPVCRSEIDPATPLITTPFNFPAFDPGYFTFTPGSGKCLPLNIWRGAAGIDAAALDWVTTDSRSKLTLEQFVVTAFMRGSSADWFELPGGPAKLLAGVEYRDESSENRLSALEEGLLPGTATIPAGTNIASVSANGSPLFPAELSRRSESGDYTAADVYFEASLPFIIDRPGARELTLETALRFSDYSTVGSATTWKANVIYAPSNFLSLRGGFARAVRAPNITELFAPVQNDGFFVFDPCDVQSLAALAAADATLAAQTEANCVATFAEIGLDPLDPVTNAYQFRNPVQGAVTGIRGGNASLSEETADTITLGFVLEPLSWDGFSISADYWNIEIDDAIGLVAPEDIVDGCYVGASLNPSFCQFSSRNSDANSIFFGGLSSIQSTNVNFARVEAAGIDLDVRTRIMVADHEIRVGIGATRLLTSEAADNPLEPSEIDSSLGEFQRPKWSGNVFIDWRFDRFAAQWQSRYTGKQLLPFANNESFLQTFGPSVEIDATWVHDLTGAFQLNDRWRFTGGVRNLNDERPFITEIAYPASIRGRYFFVGAEWLVL
ncbi:MAG: TonB-dependent receptor [Pseudomonadota bacterium]